MAHEWPLGAPGSVKLDSFGGSGFNKKGPGKPADGEE